MDDVAQQEQRERRILLWFFWLGIVSVTAGELVFVSLMETGASGESASMLHLAFLVGVVGGLVGAVWATNHWEVGGGGLSTALISWMLAKAIVIMGFAALFLIGTWWPSIAFVTVFATIMVLLRPGKFA